MHAQSLTTADQTSDDTTSDIYAPGHLGALTSLIPTEMVDEALTATGTRGHRLRALPARVCVYLVLAASLFPEVSLPGIWRKLTTSLPGLTHTAPSASGLCQARRRLGPAPLKWLFGLLAGPEGATPDRKGVWWKGLLLTAIDGTVLTVADTAHVRSTYTKQAGNHGGTGYPQARLLALVACGTRAMIDVVFGPTTTGETTYLPTLLRSTRAGMLVIADRNFDAGDVLTGIRGTGAEFLIRGKTNRRLPVLARHRDGSYTSIINGRHVRVIDAEVSITTTQGTQVGCYRLLTSLLDADEYPAAELVRVYHQRWEIETTYLELKSSMLDGRVLRSRTVPGIEQEIWALLVAYQVLRTTISDALLGTDTDPDRGSFTIAWETARDQVIAAGHLIAETTISLVGTIGRHVRANLLPPRRIRVNPRVVKRAISKYQARGPDFDRACRKATKLEVSILSGVPA